MSKYEIHHDAESYTWPYEVRDEMGVVIDIYATYEDAKEGIADLDDYNFRAATGELEY